MSISKLLIAVAVDYRQYESKKTVDSSAAVYDFVKRHLPDEL
jgi:hypothetical protein